MRTQERITDAPDHTAADTYDGLAIAASEYDSVYDYALRSV